MKSYTESQEEEEREKKAKEGREDEEEQGKSDSEHELLKQQGQNNELRPGVLTEWTHASSLMNSSLLESKCVKALLLSPSLLSLLSPCHRPNQIRIHCVIPAIDLSPIEWRKRERESKTSPLLPSAVTATVQILFTCSVRSSIDYTVA